MYDEIVSWLNNNSPAITASATIVLAGITYLYLEATQRILKEQVKSREINYIHQQLEKFYIPLQSHIIDFRDYHDNPSHVRSETRRANFMNYLGLCQDENIIGSLNEVIDVTSKSGATSHLKHIEEKVNVEIQRLFKELRKLIIE